MGSTRDILYELEKVQWEAFRQQRHDIQKLLNRPQTNIKFEVRVSFLKTYDYTDSISDAIKTDAHF
jgi:hypothetical protein